jgi:hypothetical protein
LKPDFSYLLVLVAFFAFILSATINSSYLESYSLHLKYDYSSNKATAAILEGQHLLEKIRLVVPCSNELLWRLTASIVLLENYFRNTIQRSVEFAVIDNISLNEEALKKMSFGIAQMTPVTAIKSLLELGVVEEFDLKVIMELLRDDDASFLLVYGYLRFLSRTSGQAFNTKDFVDYASKRYNSSEDNFFSKLYSQVVMKIYESNAMNNFIIANNCIHPTVFPLRFKTAADAQRYVLVSKIQ